VVTSAGRSAISGDERAGGETTELATFLTERAGWLNPRDLKE
jgi:hypothetical protein